MWKFWVIQWRPSVLLTALAAVPPFMGVPNQESQSNSERSKTEPGFAAVGDYGSSGGK